MAYFENYMNNLTIGLIFMDIAMAIGFYKLGGTYYAVCSLLGSAVYFMFLAK